VAGLRDVLTAMADQIRDALHESTFPVQVEPKYVLSPSPLTVDIYPADLTLDLPTAGFDELGGHIVTVRARIGTADFDAAYDVLLSLLDETDDLCLVQALYDDATLGGMTTDIDLREQTGLRAYEHPSGEGAHLGCQWTFVAIPAHS
jgi:hypothetical protein